MIRTIAVSVMLMATVAHADRPGKVPDATPQAAKPWRVVGKLEHKPIAECSGIVASRKHPGVFWVHNDSGNPATLYAVKQDGTLVGPFAVAATNQDWEDIAIDDAGHLYIGDIGNNGSRRKELVVYRLAEPEPSKAKDIVRVKVDRKWVLTFPERPFDCEAMFVHGGHGYLISKIYFGGQAGVYRFSLEEAKGPVVLERVGSVPVRTPVTAADVSPDGKRLAVLSVAGVNVFDFDGDVKNVGNSSSSFVPYVHATMEACCFTDGGILVATEPREMVMFEIGGEEAKSK